MRSRKNNKKMIVLVVMLLLLSMGIGYAYLTKILKINNTANIAKTTWDLHFENVIISEGSTEGTPTIDESKTSVSLSVNFINPGDYFEYTVDVVNGGTVDAMVSLLSNNLTEEQERYLKYTITYIDDIEMNPYDQLLAGDRDTIKVRISLKDEGIPEDLHFTIETSVDYAQANENAKERKKKISLLEEMKKIAVDDTSINYGTISSDTNGKGVYHLTKIATSTPIYYYRGEVYNNNVLFGGFCWKIIRTTETGGVKLIYNGKPNNGVCDATGDATEIGKTPFNPSYNNVNHVGYMLDSNTKDSTIKGVVDEWFLNNLLDYQGYLEDTPFYNERDYVKGVNITHAFASRQRIWGTRTDNYAATIPRTYIKLGAANKEDRFTVSSEIGNGALTYPVGLITADEVIMAGGRGQIDPVNSGTNKAYYLYTGSEYWTLSPNTFDSMNYVIFVCGHGGFYAYPATNKIGVRPVISLNKETIYSSGNGTKENPFVITK